MDDSANLMYISSILGAVQAGMTSCIHARVLHKYLNFMVLSENENNEWNYNNGWCDLTYAVTFLIFL